MAGWQSRCERYGEERNVLPLLGFEPRLADRPAGSSVIKVTVLATQCRVQTRSVKIKRAHYRESRHDDFRKNEQPEGNAFCAFWIRVKSGTENGRLER